jgi:hypothetical protein
MTTYTIGAGTLSVRDADGVWHEIYKVSSFSFTVEEMPDEENSQPARNRYHES